MPSILHETLTLQGDSLRIAVVADTHSNPHEGGLEHLRALAPQHLLHAGDIGNTAVLTRLAGIAPLSAVRGNIDGHGPDIPDIRVIDVRADATLCTLLLLHIAVNGPRLRADAARLAERHDASIVVCGHSHVPFIGRDRGRVLFNPGSLGPRRFQLPILFGVIDVTRTGIDIHHVDAETGTRWHP